MRREPAQGASQLARRVLAGAEHDLRQSWLPGRTPPASAGSSPALTTDDLPLPDGPTTANSDAPTRCATSSATSSSRPKKYSASSRSNAARPLYGQRIDAGAGWGSTRSQRRLQLGDAPGEFLREGAGVAAAGRRP